MSSWIGQTSKFETPDSGGIRTDQRGQVATYIYEGEYDVLQAAMPAWQDAATTGYVEEVTLEKKGEGGSASRMIVVARNASTWTVDEVEWVPVQKSLKLHSNYCGLTRSNLQEVDQIVSGQQTTDSATALVNELANLLLQGMGWETYAPVCRRTQYNFLTFPSVGQCGKRETPPTSHPSGYEWRRSADRCIREGVWWTRIQEWTGADSWNSTIYPS